MLLTLLKATAAVGAALWVAGLVPRLSSASRHSVIVAGLITALLVPALEVLLPRIEVAVLPASRTTIEAPRHRALRQNRQSTVAPVVLASNTAGTRAPANPVEPGVGRGAISEPSHQGFAVPARPLIATIWLLGFAVVALRFLLSRWRIRRFARHAAGVGYGEWYESFRSISVRMKLANVTILESPDDVMPMAWGIVRGTVLVPRSGRSWPAARRRVVLAHELSHVTRRDGLWQALSQVVCAVYWFNPVVWLAQRRLLALSERASDDMVLQLGARPSDYADQLLAVATLFEPISRLEPAGLAMAGRSELSDRLISILSPQVRRGMSKRFLTVVCLSSVFGSTSVAVAHPVERSVDVPVAPVTAGPLEAFVDPTPVPAGISGANVAPPAALEAVLVPALQQVERHRSRQDTTEYHSRWQNDDYRLDIRGRGELFLTPDDHSVAAIGDDGYVIIREEYRRHEYRLEIRSVSGGLEYRWMVDGDNRDFDAEGERWFADVLESLIYRLGFAAESRVARILATDGADGVFDEIRNMESDFVQAKYFIVMLQQEHLTMEEMRRGLRLSAEEIESDFEQARILSSVAEQYLDEPELRTEFVRAARALDSDFEMRRVLENVVTRRDLAPEVVAEILDAADALDSDFERASLLTSLARSHPLEGDLQRTYLTHLRSIGSDFETRRVLSALLENGGLSETNFDVALEGIGYIESDFELAQILSSLLLNHRLTPSQQETMLRQVSTIQSDFEQRRVLTVLMDQPDLTRETQLELLRMSTRLGSDFERSAFLLETSDRFMMDDAARDAYLDAAAGIGSDFELRRVLNALVRTGGLDDDQLRDVLEAGRSIDSDFELANLLSAVAERYRLSPELRQLYEDVANEISSDFEYGRAMGGVRRSRSRI